MVRMESLKHYIKVEGRISDEGAQNLAEAIINQAQPTSLKEAIQIYLAWTYDISYGSFREHGGNIKEYYISKLGEEKYNRLKDEGII